MQAAKQRRSASAPQGGVPVYGMGLIGAMVWFWQRADDGAGRARAVFKAFAWPAFLVHDAFKALEGRR